MSNVDNGESYACMGTGHRWEISLPPFQFCCKPKTPLKKLSLLEKEKKEKGKWPPQNTFLF